MALLTPASLSGVVSLAAGHQSVGTGFLYARSIAAAPDRSIVFIVTNRHVVDGGRNPHTRQSHRWRHELRHGSRCHAAGH